MYSTETLKELMFIGTPILIKEIFVYPITVQEKIMMGLEYNKRLNLLCISESDLEDIFNEKQLQDNNFDHKITPFEYLLMSAEANDDFLLELKQAFSTFLREKVKILPKVKKIIVGDIRNEREIDEEVFIELQKVLRLQNNLDIPEEVPENENFMQKKFRLNRKKLKKAKALQATKSGDTPTFLDLMSSLCLCDVGVTWDNVKDLPIFTFYELLHRAQAKEKYHTDFKALMAGADSKKIKLKYWISNNSVDE